MVNFGLVKKTELDLLHRFYEDVYPVGHILRQQEFLDWYTIASPYYRGSVFEKNGCYPIIAAYEQKKIIGQWICQPSKFNFYGRLFSMAWLSNWMIHPAWRHRGVGVFFIKFLLEQDFDVFAANMVTPEVNKMLTHFGYSHHDLRRYLAVLSPQAIRLVQRPTSQLQEKINSNLIIQDNPDPAVLNDVDHFDSRYDLFWEAVFANNTMGSLRSADFLNWRYFQDPFLTYKGFVVQDEAGHVKGAVVLRLENIRNTGLKACRLVEFIVDPAFVTLAMKSVLVQALKRGCVFMDFYNLLENFDKEWYSLGILKNDPVLSCALPRLTQPVSYENFFINLAVFEKHPAIPLAEFLDFKKWYTTSGDADQDRKNFS
ncbi:MAG: hypothetical protein HY454_00730 [Parcubacteria group bacterium]|nr:hypothetical protein [Parcubacteria group bacterium]